MKLRLKPAPALFTRRFEAQLHWIPDQIEEQLAADPVEWHKPQRVDDQHVDAQQTLLKRVPSNKLIKIGNSNTPVGSIGWRLLH